MYTSLFMAYIPSRSRNCQVVAAGFDPSTQGGRGGGRQISEFEDTPEHSLQGELPERNPALLTAPPNPCHPGKNKT